MKKVLIASGVAVMAFVMVAGAQTTTFTSNLTVGSRGTEVAALQNWLISKGYSIPAIQSGAATAGYFGSQTKAAVAAYQVTAGVINPGTGYVGPLTRAALNAGGVVAVVPASGCPAGYICTPTPGTPAVPVVGGPTGLTTPGIPGILSVTAGPLSSAVLNVGAQMAPVLSVRVQAQYSDLAVQSITLDLGNNTAAYNKIFNKVYVTDGTNVLASQPLNGSTVVQSSSNYIVGIAGFNLIVPRGTYKDIIIKADVNSSIDSTYLSTGLKFPDGSPVAQNSFGGTAVSGWGIGLVGTGLRAVDGAGINLTAPSTEFYQTLTINSSLVDNAQANISLAAESPRAAGVPVTDTTNSQYLGLPVLVVNVNAQNDSLHLREVKVNFGTSGTGSISAAYLYQGSTPVASASVSGGQADFSNITNGTAGASIAVDQTLPYTVKVDVTGVTSGSSPFVVTATASSTLFTIYSSNDSTATVSGTAIGLAQTVSSVGPLFTLASAPIITKVDSSAGNASVVTRTYTATFNVNVRAVGTDVELGLPASTTVNGAAFGTTTTGTNLAQIFTNGTASTTSALVASYSKPDNTTDATSNGFVIARNQTVTIPITYTFSVVNADTTLLNNNYAVQIQGINWTSSDGANGPTTFMRNQSTWRSSSI